MLQLFSVFLIQVAEPVTATVIYPFINQFVRETGITGGDEKKTGYYAGLIESAFFFAESLTVVFWGHLSDQYGRRPVLLLGPLGLTFSMFWFGMSTTFWPLMISRCFQGVFNGVSKSIIAELTDSTNRGDAYAYMPMLWSFGTTSGPIIGGLLSNAAQRWPNTLGRIPYLQAHPYFLPCAVAGLLAFVTFAIAFLGLKETLPSIVAREKLEKRIRTSSDEITEESRLLQPEEYPCYTVASSESPTLIGNDSRDSGYRAILTRPLLMTLTNHMFLTFLDMCHAVLLPLMYSTSIPLGGLGLDPFHIGATLGAYGCINSFVQMNFLGRLIRKFGARRMYIFASPAIAGCFAMYPIMSFFARRAGGVDAIVIACIVVQLTCHMGIYMAYGSLQVVLVENVPENGPMGTVNGVAQMLGSGMRSIAPTFASSLFSISLQRGFAGGNMVYYILLAMTFVASRLSILLPKQNNAKRRST
ncbi:hypothetical protein M413DRAFT_29551 [Hebeloma cylindrosporum]|uniref:Major facilitator superfamily (MFS) profile domain-containing protein n=1 Tax=Hebeloma cylindrosporum TaxID=76867 RepID=A0A0C2YEE4_HEBCY|nr:hypothetical protein M413DRAFT_29551 [Hebeloma cylindrosporum h7]